MTKLKVKAIVPPKDSFMSTQPRFPMDVAGSNMYVQVVLELVTVDVKFVICVVLVPVIVVHVSVVLVDVHVVVFEKAVVFVVVLLTVVLLTVVLLTVVLVIEE